MPRHVIIVDNYDSFTFNLAQGFAARGARVSVVRNDAADVSAIEELRPDALVISPGPGSPEKCPPPQGRRSVTAPGSGGTGVSGDALRALRGRIPILGVCLGHQIIARALGATVGPAAIPVHGKAGWVRHDGSGLLAPLPNPFRAARYHSLVVDPESVSEPLCVRAWSPEGEVMALEVRGEPTWGVQFHPESYLTPSGGDLLELFLDGRGMVATGDMENMGATVVSHV